VTFLNTRPSHFTVEKYPAMTEVRHIRIMT